MSLLIQSLLHIGAIQFGRFETKPGEFAPVAIRFSLLPSYPAVLHELAQELVPLVRIAGLTHLLTVPAATPLGVAVSLAGGIPLVYPAPGDPQTIEGAYDFNVPTILLTDVLGSAGPDRGVGSMIARVKPLGLDVKAVVTVLDLGIQPGELLSDLPTSIMQASAWRSLRGLLPEIPGLTPSMRAAVEAWLANPGEQPDRSE